MITSNIVKKAFARHGLSVSGWARENGFSQALVYQVLSGKRQPIRGESHRIAVALGLKEGVVGDYEDLGEYLKRGRKTMD